MKSKDLMTITTVALGTATLTVVTLLAGSMEAGNDADSPTAGIATPKFTAHGVEMTMAPAEGQVFKAGDEPVLELTAVNTSDQSVSISTCITMTASSPEDRFSRVIRMPASLWQQYQMLTLNGKETKVITVETKKSLPANSSIAVSLREAQPATAPVANATLSINALPTSTNGPVQTVQLVGLNDFYPGIAVLSFSTVAPAARPLVAAK